jgi:hypothetical protein
MYTNIMAYSDYALRVLCFISKKSVFCHKYYIPRRYLQYTSKARVHYTVYTITHPDF